ncbi:phosphoribosyltransferase [Clostridium beijerinckii]|uniref:phosphoribosyltransferase n=1 Tax=Clostridium beijerinckii TaxID=1520 RepID=UPI001494616D|nr:phosphoribosyltransferase [Clostridium beijerinckii]NOW07774.1 orotate phosphoribosyltransferase [Clostridium beijerinckii]NYC04452.1 orotate phosphoribosyltransferase [Clostridium beijerinckii]
MFKRKKEIQDHIGCGSFAIVYKNFMNYFNLYVLDNIENEKLKFDLQTYKFQPSTTDEADYGLGKWELDSPRSGNFEIIKENILNELENIQESSQLDIFGEEEGSDEIIDGMIEEQSEKLVRNSDEKLKEYSTKLLSIVNYKKMFKSGHFHWGEDSKAHGWLDTNSLLSDCEYAELSVNALLHLIKINLFEADLVVGIGMEGNIIAPSIAIALGAGYTYIPVTTRESSDFERQIRVNGSKKVLIITDTIFTGQTVYRILNRYNDEFSKFEKISLVSIFYTGTILSELSEKVDYRYIVDDIKIDFCNNNHENCLIYKNNLDIVYEL